MARIAIVVLLGALLLLPVGVLAQQNSSEKSAAPGFTYHKLTAGEAAEFSTSMQVMPEVNDSELAIPDSADWNLYVGQLNIVDSVTAPAGAGSVDMTIYNSQSFPKIGDQGSQGSCAAWAATYYSYGYMEAVDQGWTQAKNGVASQLLSPAWTYNRVIADGGGSWMWDNFFIIRDWGVPTLASMPYNQGNDINWGSEAAWREAPLHRGLDVNVLKYEGSSTIKEIKALINLGIPVTFCLNSAAFSAGFSDGNYIISSAEYDRQGLNHAQTFVGYDDSINDDGNIGAFRVANSWGSTWGDAGYYWITYEAINEIGNQDPDPDEGIFDNLCLSYITDRPDYVPSTMASWQFDEVSNHCGGSDANISISLMVGASVVAQWQPFTLITPRAATHYFPSFMVVDISNYTEGVLGGASVSLSLGPNQQGGALGTLISFKLEYYDNYSPYPCPTPVLVSRQASGLPDQQPFTVSAMLDGAEGIDHSTALDTPEKSYSSGGSCAWFGTKSVFHDGQSSMQSGVIGDNSVSTLQTYVYGPGSVSFWWKISSERYLDSGDVLSFYVDTINATNEKSRIVGEVDWQQVAVTFGTGRHLLSWQYAKDDSAAVGEDAGWVDGVQLEQTDDVLEENDIQQEAVAVSLGQTTGLICADDDWYRFWVNSGEDITVSISFARALGDLDLMVVSPDGRAFLSTGVIDRESVTVSMVGQDGILYIAVEGEFGAVNSYALEIDLTINASQGLGSSLRLDGGSGDYSGLVTSNEVQVEPGSVLSGSVNCTLQSEWSVQSMPLIYVASWWGVETYSSSNADVAEGTTSLTVDMGRFSAPTVPGDHYVLIAFRPERGGAGYLASATYSRLAEPVWGDGNDLNSLSAAQLEAAEADGRMLVTYLVSEGEYETVYVPCAVIRVHVNDHVAPVTSQATYGALGSNGWYTSSVSVLLTADDVGSGVMATYVSIDGGSPLLYSMPIGIASEGLHTLHFWSVDMMGNEESKSMLTVRIDATLPVASIEVQSTAFQGNDGYDLGRPTIILSSTDAVSGPASVEYRYDGGAWQTYYGSFQYALTTDSVMSVKAMDVAGNVGMIVTRLVKVDTVAPTVMPVLQGHMGNGQWYDSAVLVGLSVSETGSGTEAVWYSLDGITYGNYTKPFWVNETGIYHLWAKARDMAGNMGIASSTMLLIDRDLPVPSAVMEGIQGLDIWWNGPVLVQLSAQDEGSGVATIMYRLDGGNWAIYADPFVISGEGRHTLSLRASDVAGNEAMLIDSEVGIDSAAPNASLGFADPAAQSGWFLDHPMPLIEIIDLVSGAGRVTLLVDGQEIEYATGMEMHLEGVHLLRYRVADAAGNNGAWAEVTIQIDTMAPVTNAVLSGALGQGGWYLEDVLVTLATVEDISGLSQFEVRWDGGAWAPSNGSITSAVEGRRTLEYRATDVAGNVEYARVASIWIDRSAPVAQLTTPDRDHVTTRTAEVRWNAVDDASGISAVLVSVDGGAFVAQVDNATRVQLDDMADGTHQIVVRLMDAAGNSIDLEVSIAVDTNPFSPNGPYGPWPIIIILGAVAAVAAGLILRKRR